MPLQEHILDSKLSIPIHPGLFVPQRLSAILGEMTGKRLAVVTAGAGHGKTALTAWAVRQGNIKPVWYTPDDQDRDFSRFIRYVATGLKPYARNNTALADGQLSGAPFSAARKRRVLEALSSSLEAPAGHRICLVLDDFHTVQGEADIRESVEFLLKHLPRSFHLILLTRSQPKIRLSQLRLTGQVAQINEADLLFTPDETRDFFTRHFRLTLPPGLWKKLHRISKGWAAGLVLLYLDLEKAPSGIVKELPANLTGPGNAVFTYLEEKIFLSLAPETRDFMLRTAPLETLDPQFCNAVLNIGNSGEILDQLAQSHLLTYQNESGPDLPPVYTYHHLLRSFLLTRLKQLLPGDVTAGLYRKIARLLEAEGQAPKAVRFYIAGGFFDLAADRLTKLEKMLFASGQVNRIRSFMKGFPRRFILSTPQLMFIKAKLESLSGDPLKAVSSYESVLEKASSSLPPALLLNTRIQLGLNYYYSGHIPEAEKLLETCMACGDPGKHPEISGLLILIYTILGKIEKADQLAEAAHSQISQLPESGRLKMKNWIEFVLSYRFFTAGDFKTAYACARQCLDRFSRMQADIIMPLAYLHASLPAYFLGKFNTGYALAEKGLALIREMGIRDNQAGWLNFAAALHLAGLNRPDQALAHAGKGVARFKQQANYWGQANVHDLIHFIRLKQGDTGGAQKALERGLAVLTRTGLTLTQGILETGMLGIWLKTGRFEAVASEAEKTLKRVRASKFYTFKALVISAQCRLNLDDRAGALAQLAQGMEIAAQYGYARHAADAATRLEPLLVSLYSKGVTPEFIRTVFHLNGRAHCLPARPAMAAQVPPLQISLLGRFDMTLDGQPLNIEAFKNTNALMMIKYLAFNYHKGFKHRDELIELLWPEQDYNKTRRRFNVLVSAVRKFFEPRIKRGTPSQYLKKQGASFRLFLGSGGSIDVLTFQDELHKANKASSPEKAVPHYETALAAYKGPFLAEDTYIQWCLEEREQLQKIYLSILWALVCHYLDTADPVKGIYYAQKYLETDNSVEGIYQKLMQLYAMDGNRSQVKKTFEACRQNVFDTLGCPPDPETVRLFHSFFPPP